MPWNIKNLLLPFFFFSQNGTIVQRSFPGNSLQNGRAERNHRHILDTIRAFLISSSCPEIFWDEATLTVVFTINRNPSPINGNVSPFERLHNRPLDYHMLKVFGSTCFVLLQPHEHTKLRPRARLCCFLRYGIEHKGIPLLGSFFQMSSNFSSRYLLRT